MASRRGALRVGNFPRLVLTVPGPDGLVSRVARTRHSKCPLRRSHFEYDVVSAVTVQRRARSDGEHDPATLHEARVVDTRCSCACNAMRDALERVDTTRSSSFQGDTSAATFRPRRRLDGPDSQSLPNPIFVHSSFAVRLISWKCEEAWGIYGRLNPHLLS